MFDFYAINNRQATLKNARAYCESGTYYLKLAYEYEDKDGTHQLIYPDFQIQDIDSEASGIGDNTIIANAVNKYKNMFGKPVVVVIQSQLGDPICAFSGNDVYWEVCQDLPKTTKLMIDGHALYIHRANFQLIDKDLLA